MQNAKVQSTKFIIQNNKIENTRIEKYKIQETKIQNTKLKILWIVNQKQWGAAQMTT